MLPHDYPHPPRTTKMVARVHGGRGMRFGNATAGDPGHTPWGSTAEHHTRGFRHVRGKGQKGTLVRDDPPHAVRHRTPDVALKHHHTTWGGPRDVSHDPATNLKHTQHTQNGYKPIEQDGGWLHQTKARKDHHVLSTGASVAYDFLRPNVGYNDQKGLLNIQGSQQVIINPSKKISYAYTSGAGDHDMITHQLDPYAAHNTYKREITPHTLKRTLMKKNQDRHGKNSINKSNPHDSHHHGYNILTNKIFPEHREELQSMKETMENVTMAKHTSKMRPHDTLTGIQGHVPGGPVPVTMKTTRPKAIMNSEGYAYDILTHRETSGERLERFDKASTKSFRRLANAFERKTAVVKKGRLKAEKLRQRRVNTIARTAHVPRRQQNRGFNIVNGQRTRDIAVNDPRRCPKKTGLQPKSVWAKCGHEHNNIDLAHHPMKGLRNTAGRALHTKLPPQQADYDRRNGKAQLAARITEPPSPPQRDVVHVVPASNRLGKTIGAKF